jgi:diguanylate cyclase (GGDEF)-like protein
MTVDLTPSIVFLATQSAAITLVAILFVLLVRSTPRTSLRYWTAAWVALAGALVLLLGSFASPSLAPVLIWLYMLGEYVFGYLFLAGCRFYATGARLSRRDAWLLAPAALFACVVALVSRAEFNVTFIPHSALFSYLFFASFRVLYSARKTKRFSHGMRVMSVALVLLGVDFLHYVPIFAYSALYNVDVPFAHLRYSSLYDLIFEILLGFGTIMLVMEEVAHDLEWSNRQLIEARDRMEVLARLDPLTGTLNRHGLYSVLEQHGRSPDGARAGSLAVIDMDDLKRINDTLGHAAGDAAIRAVARAIRGLIRADDLLIRWGGDEFLVLLFGVNEAEARRRLEELGRGLGRVLLPGNPEAVTLSVSCGTTYFTTDGSLDAAIERADDAMYLEKEQHRVARGA